MFVRQMIWLAKVGLFIESSYVNEPATLSPDFRNRYFR